MQLFHGSHNGIQGEIHAKSRVECDFGMGFYLGDNIDQAKAMIQNDKNGVLYTMEVDLDNLKVYTFDDEIKWALYVGCNRERINVDEYPKLKSLVDEINSHDVIVGIIADDKVARSYNQFINGDLTDKGLLASLKYVNRGKQYVFKNSKACGHIKILSQERLSSDERKELVAISQNFNHDMEPALEKIKTDYRRDGLFIDEILEKWR